MNLNNLGAGKKLIDKIIAQGKSKNIISQQVRPEKNPHNANTRPPVDPK